MIPMWGTVLLLYVLAWPLPASARVEYALETGKPCGACHQDPGGGGSLTAGGVTFQAQKTGVAAAAPLLSAVFLAITFALLIGDLEEDVLLVAP